MPVNDPWRTISACSQPTNLQVSLNTLYWKTVAETGIGATTLEVATALDVILAPLYKAVMPATSFYRGTSAQYLVPPINVPQFSIANQGVGVASGNNLPMQASGIVSLRTGLSGVRWRGRIYVGFPPASFADATGAMTAAAGVAYEALATALRAGFTAGIVGNQSTLALALRTEVVPNTVPKTYVYNRILFTQVPVRFATQRRRGQFGRVNNLPF